MKELGLPLLILVVLIAAMLFFLFTPRNTAPMKQAVFLTLQQQEKVDKAEKALENTSFKEALQLLEPMKNIKKLKLQLILAEAQARLGKFSATQTAQLEKEVVKDRGLPEIFRLAQLFEATGELKKAKEYYQELSKVKLPDSLKIKVFSRLGALALGFRENALAIEAFQTLVKQDPSQVTPYVELFTLLTLASRSEEIEPLREQGDIYHDKRFPYHFGLGKAYFDLGKNEEAIMRFQKCVEAKPQNVMVRFFLYQLFRRTRKIPESLEELEKIVSGSEPLPLDVRAAPLCFEASLEAKQINRLDLAFKFLRTALLENRSFLGLDDRGTINEVERYILDKGTSEEKMFEAIFMSYINGDYEKAVKAMEAGLSSIREKRLKEDGKKLIEECRKIVDADNAYFALIARKKALEDGRKIPVKPVSVTATPVQAKSSGKQPPVPASGSSVAISDVAPPPPPRIIVTQAPVAPPAPVTGPNPKNAARIAQIKSMARESSQDASAQFTAAVQLQRFKDNDGAKALFREAATLDPNLAEAHFNLALIAQIENNPQETVTNLENAIQVNPQNSKYKSVMALTLIDCGDVSNALEMARSAVEIDPANSEGHYAMAKVLYQSRRAKEALEAINKGLEAEKSAPSRITQGLEAMRNQIKAEN